jgi:hypothetical protein
VSPRRINTKNQAPKTKEIPNTKIQLGPSPMVDRRWALEVLAQSHEIRRSSQEDSTAHRLAAPFGVWILDLLWFWSLVFGVSSEVLPTFNHTQ